MKNLIYFHTDSQAECLRRVAELIDQNYRVERLVIRKRGDGDVFCRVKARRSIWGYLMCLAREVRRLPMPAIVETSGATT